MVGTGWSRVSRQGAGPLVCGGGALGPHCCWWAGPHAEVVGGPHGNRGARPPRPRPTLWGVPQGVPPSPFSQNFSGEIL